MHRQPQKNNDKTTLENHSADIEKKTVPDINTVLTNLEESILIVRFLNCKTSGELPSSMSMENSALLARVKKVEINKVINTADTINAHFYPIQIATTENCDDILIKLYSAQKFLM